MQSHKRGGLRNTPNRRGFTLATVIKSISHPRRKIHRRHDENPDAQRDWYPPRLFALLVGIAMMSVADAAIPDEDDEDSGGDD